MPIMKFVRYLVFVTLSVVALYIYYYGLKPSTYDCDSVIKNLSGKEYKIQVCGAGHDERTSRAILRVLSVQGELLAEVTVEYAHGTDPESAIFFFNEGQIGYIGKNDSLRAISIPPTPLDWIRARLP